MKNRTPFIFAMGTLAAFSACSGKKEAPQATGQPLVNAVDHSAVTMPPTFGEAITAAAVTLNTDHTLATLDFTRIAEDGQPHRVHGMTGVIDSRMEAWLQNDLFPDFKGALKCADRRCDVLSVQIIQQDARGEQRTALLQQVTRRGLRVKTAKDDVPARIDTVADQVAADLHAPESDPLAAELRMTEIDGNPHRFFELTVSILPSLERDETDDTYFDVKKIRMTGEVGRAMPLEVSRVVIRSDVPSVMGDMLTADSTQSENGRLGIVLTGNGAASLGGVITVQ